MLTWSHKRRPRFHWKYCDLYDQMHSENRLSSSKRSNPDRVRPCFFYWMSQNLRVFDLKQGCRKIQLWILWYHNKASCFNLKSKEPFICKQQKDCLGGSGCIFDCIYVDILVTVGFQSIEIAKKVFVTFDTVFHIYLMSGLKKYAKKFFFMVSFFLNPLHQFWHAHRQIG